MECGRVVAQRLDERLTPEAVEELLAEATAKGLVVKASEWRAIVASTRADSGSVVAMLRKWGMVVLEFTPQTPVPLANAYRTPETLGRDRLAAAVGAATLFPGRNVLVADFGTAVTIDLVTADGTYRGGCISPGLEMRFRALHDYTASLPLCEASEEELLCGLTTQEAVTHGVMNSLSFEIEGYISRMQSELDDLCVIFTGGDAKILVKRIKNTIFANRNLVLCGLDRILEYNASEEHLD